MTIIFKTLLARVIDEFEHFVSSTSPYGLRFDSRLLVAQFHKIVALFTLVPRNSEKRRTFAASAIYLLLVLINITVSRMSTCTFLLLVIAFRLTVLLSFYFFKEVHTLLS